MSSTFTYNRNLVQYVDYDIDVIVQKDGSFNVVDLDEYEENTTKLQYPKHIKDKLKEELQVLKEWIYKGQNPFNEDRKSTRLNSSHVAISYAVFCLTKKK